jgi:arginase
MTKKVHLILNSSELGAGTRGASLGPAAIQVAAREIGSCFFGTKKTTRIIDRNHLLDLPTSFPFSQRIDGIVEVATNIVHHVSQVFESNEFPLVLAADHSSAAFTIGGIRKAFSDKKLGVIWIDAHGDLHSPYTTPSGNIHGMPLAIALGLDNLEMKRNELDEKSYTYWENLKQLAGAPALFQPENLVFIGVRDTEKEEEFLMQKHGIRNFQVEEIRQKGVDQIVKETTLYLSACDIIYVSFDVDSMDPDLTSYGTGTPVKDGLTIEEARSLLVQFTQDTKTVCLEVVEVNPCLDNKKNKMAEIAFDLIQSVAEVLEEK